MSRAMSLYQGRVVGRISAALSAIRLPEGGGLRLRLIRPTVLISQAACHRYFTPPVTAAQNKKAKKKGVWAGAPAKTIRQPRDRTKGQPQERSLIAGAGSTPVSGSRGR